MTFGKSFDIPCVRKQCDVSIKLKRAEIVSLYTTQWVRKHISWPVHVISVSKKKFMAYQSIPVSRCAGRICFSPPVTVTVFKGDNQNGRVDDIYGAVDDGTPWWGHFHTDSAPCRRQCDAHLIITDQLHLVLITLSCCDRNLICCVRLIKSFPTFYLFAFHDFFFARKCEIFAFFPLFGMEGQFLEDTCVVQPTSVFQPFFFSFEHSLRK